MKHAARFGSESTGRSRSVKKFKRTLFMKTIADSITPYNVCTFTFIYLSKNAQKSQARARHKTWGKGKVFCYFNFQITIAKNSDIKIISQSLDWGKCVENTRLH